MPTVKPDVADPDTEVSDAGAREDYGVVVVRDGGGAPAVAVAVISARVVSKKQGGASVRAEYEDCVRLE